MKIRLAVAATVVAFSLIACVSQEDAADSDGTWVGTITTEGNVTTVVNQSGSVWGGTATLVEEASIGVESGRDEYMLGLVTAVAADDERIWVTQPTTPTIRTYDHSGAYLGDLGRQGQGPGEYVAPLAIAAAADGRVFVYDNSRRVNVYAADGGTLATWSIPNFGCCAWPMLMRSGSRLWVPVVAPDVQRSDGQPQRGVQELGAEGLIGEPLWPPDDLPDPRVVPQAGGRDFIVPFSPHIDWGVAGAGSVAVGSTDRYRFAVHRGDGTVLIIERYWEPVQIAAEHREWERRHLVSGYRQASDPSFQWDGGGIPAHQPAFRNFIPARSGELWVERHGASERLTDCVEDPIEAGYDAAFERPCWKSEVILDVFGRDGRYLGAVEPPAHLARGPLPLLLVIDGAMVIATIEDEAGTIMVKRYRLVLPGEGS